MLYMVTWIPSIYPLYVSIYTSTMHPIGIYIYILSPMIGEIQAPWLSSPSASPWRMPMRCGVHRFGARDAGARSKGLASGFHLEKHGETCKTCEFRQIFF